MSNEKIPSGTEEKIKVLYVDDEPNNLGVFKAAFRRKFEVYLAMSAEEGLKILEGQEIPVIVSDQIMPKKTGIEFLAEVKEKYPQTVRILFTGFAEMTLIQEALKTGTINSYLNKPFKEEEVFARIEQAFADYKENLGKKQ